MHTATRLFMRAPRRRIFDLAGDVTRWPEYLPHYRFVRVLERGPDFQVVHMGARRGWLPVSWVSRYRADAAAMRMHFEHLRAFTKGMVVVWEFHEQDGGTMVTIRHDLNFRVPALAPVAEAVIGGFFIDAIAPRTLECFRRLAEMEPEA